jgi:hypothetical protein
MRAHETTAAEYRSATRDDDDQWRAFRSSIATLRARIHGNGASDLVLAELLEDDLRQSRIAVQAITEFLDETVEVIGRPGSSAANVVDASDPAAALEACEQLESLLPAVRRRLGQVALRLTRR